LIFSRSRVDTRRILRWIQAQRNDFSPRFDRPRGLRPPASILHWLPFQSMAQVASANRRIAWLANGTSRQQAEFVAGLRELGWAQGKNLIIDTRFVAGDLARVVPLTAELFALKPDVFIASTDALARVAAQTDTALRVVFLIGFDPVASARSRRSVRAGRQCDRVLGSQLRAQPPNPCSKRRSHALTRWPCGIATGIQWR
jgi:hypothetical protein